MPRELAVFSETKRLSLHPESGYWEGPGDFLSGLVMGMCRVSIWVIGVMRVINPLTKSP